MNYPQKEIARKFYDDLNIAFGQSNSLFSKLFWPKNSNVTINIEGVGVHWYCKVRNADRKCSIACFNYDFPFKQGVEYYIEFIKNDDGLATGRTGDSKLAIEAIKDWTDGKTIPELYKTYTFVDQFKRKLEYINTALLNLETELKNCTSNFEQSWGDSFEYTLSNKDRAIKYYIDGYSNPPKNGFGFKFLWDDCPVFYAYNEDLNSFKSLVLDWLIKNIKPSELKKSYPWIELYTIAAHYENGDGVTGEFIESWDHVEKFYSEKEFHLKEKILSFIKAMRTKGFDKSMRAGTSLYSLILSKSRRHGLCQNQPSIMFSFGEEGIYVSTDSHERTLFKDIILTDEISNLLQSLDTQKIT